MKPATPQFPDAYTTYRHFLARQEIQQADQRLRGIYTEIKPLMWKLVALN